MRAGVSTVQQTLTTEAANVLKLAVAEAQRRGHAQVTPLHVATTLLSGTTSVLRQACIQSHLHLPQPPHCRNLELCFKVALDRLQTTSSTTTTTTAAAAASPAVPGSSSNTTTSPSSNAGLPSSSSSCSSPPASQIHQFQHHPLHHHHHHHHHHHLHQNQPLHHHHHHHLHQNQAAQQQQQQQQQQPALSNALVAALKRAQAHQRRGYPEQQQVPLLAVKVEMEQLIISILDDPSVSRVMREASFSSTQVKNSLEEALAAAAAAAAANSSSSPITNSLPHQSSSSSSCALQARRILPCTATAAAAATASIVGNNLNLNPSNVDRLRLKLGSLDQLGASPFQRSSSNGSNNFTTIQGLQLRNNAADHHHYHHQHNLLMGMTIPPSPTPPTPTNICSSRSSQDCGRVFEILLKSKKRNPLLFGEQSPHAVAEEVMQRLDKGECEACLRNLRIVSPQFASIALGLHARDEVESKLGELLHAVEDNLSCSSGVLVYLGDLQWLVERPSSTSLPPPGGSSVFCPVQHAVSEIGKLVANGGSRVWLMGVASSQTYMRCQARHPCLDTLWGLQPLPITTGFNCLTLRTSNRFGSSNPMDSSSSPVRAAPTRWPLLPFKLQAEDGNLENCCPECVAKYEQELQELEKNISSSEDTSGSNGLLPFWLKPNKDADQANGRSQKLKELQKKWSQTCRNLHGFLRINSSSLRSTPPSEAAAGNGKVACGTGAGGSLPMSIPWLSLQPQIAGANKGTQQQQQQQQLVVERNGLTVHVHGKDVGNVSSSTAEDVLSIDIGLSLKPSTTIARSTHEEDQEPQRESEVTVQTDLVLGRSSSNKSSPTNGSASNGKLNTCVFDAKAHRERVESMAAGCTPSFGFPALPPVSPPPEKRYGPGLTAAERIDRQLPAVITATPAARPVLKELDFKALCKALAESVPWQREAVDTIASTVLHCRSGAEKRRGTNLKSDTWLLFLGPDAMAKRKVARVLAEQVFGSDKMFFRLSLRSQSQSDKFSRGQDKDVEATPGRGRTPLDKLAEAVKLRPFSVVLLEDIEQADPRLKSALIKAMERGRLTDASGREVSVANLIVIMTSNLGEELMLPEETSSFKALEMNERSIAGADIVGMKLLAEEQAATPELVVHKEDRVSIVSMVAPTCESNSNSNGFPSKRKAGTSTDATDPAEKRNKAEPRGVDLDLNMPLEEDHAVKTGDSTDVLFQEVEDVSVFKDNQVKLLLEKAREQLSKQFWNRINGTIVFKPFNFAKLAELVVSEINSAVPASKFSIEVDSTLFKHLVAVLWEAQGKTDEFQRWIAQVLQTSISRMIEKLKPPEQHVIKLVADVSDSTDAVLHLPKKIKIGDETS